MTEYRLIINAPSDSNSVDLYFIKSTDNNNKCLDILDENYVKIGKYDGRMNPYGKDTYEESDILGFMKIAGDLDDINLTGSRLVIDAEMDYKKLKTLHDKKDRDILLNFMYDFIEENE
jgi:hypothetical protein